MCRSVVTLSLDTEIKKKSVNKLDHEQPAAEASNGNYFLRSSVTDDLSYAKMSTELS